MCKDRTREEGGVIAKVAVTTQCAYQLDREIDDEKKKKKKKT